MKHRMRHSAGFVALTMLSGSAICVSQTCAAPAPAVTQATVLRVPPADYQGDSNFRVKLVLSPRLAPTGKVVDEIGERVADEAVRTGRVEYGGSRLMVQDSWGPRPVGIAVADTSARSVMDALAVIFGGGWYRTEEGRVLAVGQRTAQSAARQQQSRASQAGGPSDFQRAASRRMSAFFRSLTPAQISRMRSGERLRGTDLTQPQWATLRAALLLKMRDPNKYSSTPRAQALQGQLALWIDPHMSPGGTVALIWPTVDPVRDGIPSILYDLPVSSQSSDARAENGQPTAFSAHAPLGPETPLEPAVHYRKDPAFGVNLKVAAPGWDAVVTALHEQVKASLVMQGDWLNKPPAFPVAGMTAVQVMDEIARAGSGKWEQIGPIWTLIPNPKNATSKK
jgi:hypothetical protein